jgi:hypothetical protein
MVPSLSMRKLIMLAIFLGPLAATHVARAQPPLPAAFYGSVVVDGKPVPDGTEVKALINGIDCTQPNNGRAATTVTEGGVSVYVVLVVAAGVKQGCGTQDSEIVFTVNGQAAVQRARWRDSFVNPAQQINLSVGEGSPVPLPTATPQPTRNPTQAAATGTAASAFTPLPAATSLPTDTLTIAPGGRPGSASPAASSPGRINPTPAIASPVTSDGGFPVLGAVLVVLGAVVLTGAAAGYALSRRGKRPPESDGEA